MNPATVNQLMDKADFPPSTALAIAEAFDIAMTHAQVVTVPVMDARFALLEARLDQRFGALQSRVDQRFGALESRFAIVDARFAAVEARFTALEGKIDARFREQDARLDARLARMQLHLIFWILGAMVGNNYLPQMAAALGRAIESIAAR